VRLRSPALFLLLGLVVGSISLAPAPASATTTTISMFAVRSASSPVTEFAPLSFAGVNGVNNSGVGLGSTIDGRLVIDAQSTLNNQRWGLSMPRKVGVGTYPVRTSTNGPGVFAILDDGSCDGDGSAVVHDAAWSSTGDATRLSITVVVPCTGRGADRLQYAEIRVNEPSTSAVGEVEVTGSQATAATVVGTPIDVTRTFVNNGAGPAVMGAAQVAWSYRNTYEPAYQNSSSPFTISVDGCEGKTLAPQQTCTVTTRFAPQLFGDDHAVITVPDGRPRPGGTTIYVTASQMPDQAQFVEASGQLGAEVVTWSPPGVSSTGKAYDGFQVLERNPDGSLGQVVATTGPSSGFAGIRVDVDGLADRTTYGYVVRTIMPGGGLGPVSAPAQASTAGRLMLYEDHYGNGAAGLNTVSLDPAGLPAVRYADGGTADHLAMSPDTVTLASSGKSPWSGNPGYSVCAVVVLPRVGRSAAVEVPVGSSTSCDTFPTFTSNGTIVFSRRDDVASSASAPYLLSDDLATGTLTPVPGGAGLTQPAAAPDGTLVAVDPVARALVRVAPDGGLTPILNTTDATEPAVSSSGRIAFVVSTIGVPARPLRLVDADGSNPRSLTGADAWTSAPSWTSDGKTVYYAQNESAWRLDVTAAGTPEQLQNPSNGYYVATPIVIDVPDTTAPVITTVPTLPAYTGKAGLSVSAAATDPGPAGSGVASYDARYRTGPAGGAMGDYLSPVGWTAASTGSFTLAVINGQQYCVSVRATDQVGNVGAWSPETCTISDTTPPIGTITSAPVTISNSSAAAFGYSGTDPSRPSAALAYRCRLDAAAFAPCVSPTSYAALKNGLHTFQVVAVDETGNASTAASRTWRVDTVLPTVATTPTPVFSLATTVGLRYAAADTNGSGIANYDVRYRLAVWNAGFGAMTYPAGWQKTTAAGVSLTAAKGRTYCLSVRSRDKAGNLSGWSAERCTGVALDDRSLAASRGWSRGTSWAYYGHTFTSASRTGVTLTRTGVQARRLTLVATTCHGCGTVGIYWNGKLLKTIVLNASTTTLHRTISIIDFGSPHAGTLTIKTLNTRRTYIDGLATSRT
jgi:hypothetical protein